MAYAFRDRVCLVTGGASGIGRALGEALAARGTRVLLADLQHAKAAEAAASIGAESLRLDVTDREAFAAAVAGIAKRHGRLDCLFNNAGIGLTLEAHEMAAEDWRRAVEINLMGVVHGVEAAYPLMIRQGSGRIVNTGSMSGLAPLPPAAYAMTKHAVTGLSLALRAEAAAFGVRVHVACPGYVETAILEGAGAKGGYTKEQILRALPMKPMTAARCAAAILRGVERDRAVIPVGAMARGLWWMNRLAPGATVRAFEIAAARVRRLKAP